MFLLRNYVRCRVVSYAPLHPKHIRISYAYTADKGDYDCLAFIDVEARDLFLAELDAGKLVLIDIEKIQGLVT